MPWRGAGDVFASVNLLTSDGLIDALYIGRRPFSISLSLQGGSMSDLVIPTTP